ncbi:MAG: hypothetical protein K5854_09610 [Prevotella sp.]|nr:hypothetical protein [Prevotella sp.]
MKKSIYEFVGNKELVDEFIYKYKHNFSITGLGRHFQISPKSVYRIVHLLGLPKRQYGLCHNTMFRALFNDFSTTELAEHFGVTISTVCNNARRLGLEKKKPRAEMKVTAKQRKILRKFNKECAEACLKNKKIDNDRVREIFSDYLK